MKGYGKISGKILMLLANGVVLGSTKDKKEREKILRDSDRIWMSFDAKVLNRILRRFQKSGLAVQRNENGRHLFAVTETGRRKALAYSLNDLKIKIPRKWDKRWRMVLFDIPEPKRKKRDALRDKIKQLGFLEFQKSVFVFPYPCDDEINSIINFFDIAENVYCIEASINPDAELRKHFKI
ncbi:hypothetical protein HYW53_00435 [Candidatus Giovannonibacteria bacterium]|nr:hypothetical protein [Candidatus Giovannonibacteria bacterium]